MFMDIFSRKLVGYEVYEEDAESVVRTLKYRPQWPSNGFKDLADVRQWVERFVHWYNHEHKHSKIRFVTPQQRHLGQDQQILNNRKAVLEKARNKTPSRWGGREVRNCTVVGAVMLNPDRAQRISEDELKAA
jgi:transposase InsO family protein